MSLSENLPTRFTNIVFLNKHERVFTAFDQIQKLPCYVKRFDVSTEAYMNEYLRQLSIYQLFGKCGIAPKFLFHTAISKYGYIAMNCVKKH